MRIAIVGSREFPEMDMVREFVAALPSDAVVISGGARGVDSVAEEAAGTRGLETVIFPAEWDRHGKKAGFLRNKDIVAAADKVVAFWDGKSKGTAHTIRLAQEAGKTVEIHQRG